MDSFHSPPLHFYLWKSCKHGFDVCNVVENIKEKYITLEDTQRSRVARPVKITDEVVTHSDPREKDCVRPRAHTLTQDRLGDGIFKGCRGYSQLNHVVFDDTCPIFYQRLSGGNTIAVGAQLPRDRFFRGFSRGSSVPLRNAPTPLHSWVGNGCSIVQETRGTEHEVALEALSSHQTSKESCDLLRLEMKHWCGKDEGEGPKWEKLNQSKKSTQLELRAILERAANFHFEKLARDRKKQEEMELRELEDKERRDEKAKKDGGMSTLPQETGTLRGVLHNGFLFASPHDVAEPMVHAPRPSSCSSRLASIATMGALREDKWPEKALGGWMSDREDHLLRMCFHLTSVLPSTMTTMSTLMLQSFVGVAYLAPEICVFTPSEPPVSRMKADVYSFGIILWEILSKKQPWPGMNDVQIMMSVVTGNRPEPTLTVEFLANSGWNRGEIILELLNRCWDHDPGNRPSSAEISRTLTWFGTLQGVEAP